MRLVAQTYVHAAYDRVWAHLTEAERYGAWYSAPGQRFGTQPGEPVAWGAAGGEPVHHGVLQALEPGQRIVHTFSFSAAFVQPEETSRVTWTVVQQGPVVWVRVEHDCADAPQTAAIIGDTGWVKALARLKTLLETGQAMPWPEEGAPS